VLRSTSRWIIGSWGRPWRVCIGELDILIRWQRDPNFYLEQTLTPVAEALTVPGTYNETESREILSRLNNIPAIPGRGTKEPCLATSAVREDDDRFASRHSTETGADGESAAARDDDSSDRAVGVSGAGCNVPGGIQRMAAEDTPDIACAVAIGRENYTWFLRNVASCRTRRKHWWRVPSRNGDAQSHSKG
jgi:hypothetical protein